MLVFFRWVILRQGSLPCVALATDAEGIRQSYARASDAEGIRQSYAGASDAEGIGNRETGDGSPG